MGVRIGRPNRSDTIQNNMALKYVVSLTSFFFTDKGKKEFLFDWLNANIGHSNIPHKEIDNTESPYISSHKVIGDGWEFESHMTMHNHDIVEPYYDLDWYHRIDMKSYTVFIKTIVSFDNEQDAVITKLILDDIQL